MQRRNLLLPEAAGAKPDVCLPAKQSGGENFALRSSRGDVPLREDSKEDTSSLANLWFLSFRQERNLGRGLSKPAMWYAGTFLQKHCGCGSRRPANSSRRDYPATMSAGVGCKSPQFLPPTLENFINPCYTYLIEYSHSRHDNGFALFPRKECVQC